VHGRGRLDWLLGSAIGFDVQIEEVTADVAALAMRGPTSCAVLKSMGFVGIERAV
jgi:aminomethyltransferase